MLAIKGFFKWDCKSHLSGRNFWLKQYSIRPNSTPSKKYTNLHNNLCMHVYCKALKTPQQLNSKTVPDLPTEVRAPCSNAGRARARQGSLLHRNSPLTWEIQSLPRQPWQLKSMLCHLFAESLLVFKERAQRRGRGHLFESDILKTFNLFVKGVLFWFGF